MKMFHWSRAECLKNYAHGDIIVMAPHVEGARLVAKTLVHDFIKRNREWWFQIDGTVYPDDREDYNTWMAKFEADIAKEPDERIAIFITGSE